MQPLVDGPRAVLTDEQVRQVVTASSHRIVHRFGADLMGPLEEQGEIIPLDVKVGDTVVYSKYGGTEITVEGEDVLILNARDVLAIIK